VSPRARRTLGLLALAAGGLALAVWLDGRAPDRAETSATSAPASSAAVPAAPSAAPAVVPDPASADPAARGAYLALAGHCAGCHTARGGAPYAGGRALATPFGTLHASNLTPDADTGLGRWSAEEFRRAMHHGVSRDGRALYPAFPYPDYTRLVRADTDALWAYLRTLAPVHAPNRPHALRFPWNVPLLLAAWRARYFRSAEFEPDPARDAAWNRGAYLVEALGHCGACHTARDAFGGPRGPALGGGEMSAAGWYAPSLLDPGEGGVARWPIEATVALLGSGLVDGAVATGPMAQVVIGSLQHLTRGDLEAMGRYLTAPPGGPVPAARDRRGTVAAADETTLALGAGLYREHCEDCHGRDGEGAPPHHPALAGNRTLTMDSPINAIRALLHGGFAPGTRGNPRPYGMPPYGPLLDDREAAALVSWLRQAWGHRAAPVGARDVAPLRPVPVE
jgi:mono/diheme cytochrome c family protein